MDYFVINGGARLRGSIPISGAKNAALPIMAAVLLTDGETVLHDVPNLADVKHLLDLLERLGVASHRDEDGSLHLRVVDDKPCHAEYDLVRKMRASVCVMGPLLARRGRAQVAMPGGCAIGYRPIDLHLRGMERLGAELELIGGDVHARADRLHGCEIFLGGSSGSTVLGTANVLMAAALAKGKTVIEAAACEPEIADLAEFLNKCGAKITGHGSPTIAVEGVESLHGSEHRIVPDRIEAGTFMVAAAITNGELQLTNCRLDHLLATVDVLRRTGVIVDRDGDAVVVASSRRLEPATLTTQPYPGYPTDLQAQMMALLSLAEGNSVITEKIFPDRFLHVAELSRMGARLRKEGSTVVVEGVRQLVGAPVMASDLRASAALVLAGLAARGQTRINRVYHIDRGYEQIETKLAMVGGEVRRLSDASGA